MRLFHVSEESDIAVFEPRAPERNDLDKSIALVWAIDERRLPNFLTPRNCPRVTYHEAPTSSPQDIERYFSSKTVRHTVVIEQQWFEVMQHTALYLYEFDTNAFELQDEAAGYYVSKMTQTPVEKYVVEDLFAALFERNVELRIVDCLWDIADEITKTSLNWSLCRMKYARPRITEKYETKG